MRATRPTAAPSRASASAAALPKPGSHPGDDRDLLREQHGSPSSRDSRDLAGCQARRAVGNLMRSGMIKRIAFVCRHPEPLGRRVPRPVERSVRRARVATTRRWPSTSTALRAAPAQAPRLRPHRHAVRRGRDRVVRQLGRVPRRCRPNRATKPCAPSRRPCSPPTTSRGLHRGGAGRDRGPDVPRGAADEVLVCGVRRKPGMELDEFHRYWWEVHGPAQPRHPGGAPVLHSLRAEPPARARTTGATGATSKA